jgi:hypothetical protein
MALPAGIGQRRHALNGCERAVDDREAGADEPAGPYAAKKRTLRGQSGQYAWRDVASIGAEPSEIDVQPVGSRLPRHDDVGWRRNALACNILGQREVVGAALIAAAGEDCIEIAWRAHLRDRKAARSAARSIAPLDIRHARVGIAARERQCGHGIGPEGTAGRAAPQPAVDIGGLQRRPGPDCGLFDCEKCFRRGSGGRRVHGLTPSRASDAPSAGSSRAWLRRPACRAASCPGPRRDAAWPGRAD